VKFSAWLCSGIVFTLLWLIVMAPARLLIEPAARAGILLGTLEGSIWSGSAKQLIIKRHDIQYSLTDVHWDFSPLDLLLGALCFSAAADPSAGIRSSGFLVGKICMQANGVTTVSDLSIELPAATLVRSENIRLQGIILLEVATLALRRDRRFENFSAQGRWIEAGAAIVADFQRVSIKLGDIAITGHHLSSNQIEFVLTSNGLERIGERKSDMMINLRFQLGLDGAWQFSGMIKPEDGMNSETRQWLAVLTEPDKAGNFNISWQSP